MGSPASHRKYQWMGFLTWAGLSTWILAGILGSLSQPSAGWIVLAATVASILCADLLSGVVHWGFDRYGTEDLPVIGPGFIKPFRDHHTDPLGICGHGFVETNGNACIACAPLLVLGLLLDPTQSLFWVTLLFGTSAGVFLTNQFHSWAHEDDVPRFVVLLQRTGLILDPAHHDLHHSGEFDSNYCITNGWMNPLMERTGIFHRIEAMFPPTVQRLQAAGTMSPQSTRGSHGHDISLHSQHASGLHSRGK